MSLYDDDDDVAVTAAAGAASITGWTKSVSWMQSQQKQSLVTKSKKNAAAAAAAAAAVAKPGSASTAAALTLPPVVNLQKTKKPPADFVDTAPRFSYGGDKVSFRECKDANVSMCLAIRNRDLVLPNTCVVFADTRRQVSVAPERSQLDSRERVRPSLA